MRLRASIGAGLLALIMLLLALRLAKLQVLDHDYYRGLALQQQTIRRALAGRRGNIYDSRGRLLATSVRRWSVFVDPSQMQQPAVRRATAVVLAHVLKMDARALLEKLHGPGRFAWIRRQIPDADAERVRRLGLPGIHLEREYDRHYPTGQLCAHVVGFTDVDGRGLGGIELELDRILRSSPGRELVLCDVARRVVRSVGDEPLLEPADGYDVYLTIDACVQNIARKELLSTVKQYAPEAAWAIVLDTRTGALLADVDWPLFDPEEPGRSSPADLKDRIVTDAYEFGSVMKPLAAAAALEARLVTPQSTFYCHRGAWKVGRRTIHDVHPYGTLTVSEIIAKSSNIGIGQIGLLLGPERFYQSQRRFGLGEPTGIHIPGEISGIIRPLRLWTRDSVISVAFGQEIATTPISVAFAFAALANGGVLLRPQIVSRIVESGSGQSVYEWSGPQVRWRAVSEHTAGLVLQMMQRVVEEGTGQRAKLKEYAVAGKTGTASLLKPDGRGYSDSRYLSSFVGTAPADSPRVLVLVSLKAPRKGSYYGGSVAAPACGQILRQTLKYLKVPPRPAGMDLAEARR